MKIEYLHCFREVAKHKSFSKAADSLYISQSSLSKKVKALEVILGGELFLRKRNNSVHLSPFGEYIFNQINNLIEDYDQLLTASEAYRLNRQRKMKIGTFLNIAHSGLLHHITSFESGESNFYLETMEMDHTHLKQALEMQQIEICFGYQELLGKFENYTIIPLFEDELILITSKQHAKQLGWTDCISLTDARNSRFCFPREDMEIFTYLINTCKAHGFAPQLTHSDVRLGTIRQYISDGMRSTLQFKSISFSKFYYENTFEFLRLEDRPRMTMCMYVMSGHRRIRDDFVTYMQKHFQPQTAEYMTSNVQEANNI